MAVPRQLARFFANTGGLNERVGERSDSEAQVARNWQVDLDGALVRRRGRAQITNSYVGSWPSDPTKDGAWITSLASPVVGSRHLFAGTSRSIFRMEWGNNRTWAPVGPVQIVGGAGNDLRAAEDGTKVSNIEWAADQYTIEGAGATSGNQWGSWLSPWVNTRTVNEAQRDTTKDRERGSAVNPMVASEEAPAVLRVQAGAGAVMPPPGTALAGEVSVLVRGAVDIRTTSFDKSLLFDENYDQPTDVINNDATKYDSTGATKPSPWYIWDGADLWEIGGSPSAKTTNKVDDVNDAFASFQFYQVAVLWRRSSNQGVSFVDLGFIRTDQEQPRATPSGRSSKGIGWATSCSWGLGAFAPRRSTASKGVTIDTDGRVHYVAAASDGKLNGSFMRTDRMGINIDPTSFVASNATWQSKATTFKQSMKLVRAVKADSWTRNPTTGWDADITYYYSLDGTNWVPLAFGQHKDQIDLAVTGARALYLKATLNGDAAIPVSPALYRFEVWAVPEGVCTGFSDTYPGEVDEGAGTRWFSFAVHGDQVFATNGDDDVCQWDGKYFAPIKPVVTETSTMGGVQLKTRDEVPKGQHIASHGNRLFIAGAAESPNILYFSDVEDLSQPGAPWERWPTEYTIPVSSQDQTGITGLVSLDDRLVIFKQDAIYVLLGSTPEDYVLRRAVQGVGCSAPRTIAVWKGVVFFVHTSGVYVFDGSTVKRISDKVEKLADSLVLGGSERNLCASVYGWRSQYWLAYNDSWAGSKARVLVYDFAHGAWFEFTGIQATALLGTDRVTRNDIMLSADTNGGVYLEDYGRAAEGEEAVYRTKSYDLGGVDINKRLWYLRLLVDSEAASKLLVRTILDDGTSAYAHAIVAAQMRSGTTKERLIYLAPRNAAKYGSAVWGASKFESSAPFEIRVPVPGQAKRVAFEFESDDVDSPAKVYGWSLEYQALRTN